MRLRGPGFVERTVTFGLSSLNSIGFIRRDRPWAGSTGNTDDFGSSDEVQAVEATRGCAHVGVFVVVTILVTKLAGS